MEQQPSQGSQIMDGLGTYAVYKAGLGIVILVIVMIVIIGFIIYHKNKNYVSTQDCNIKSNTNDKSQILTYKVNDVVYTKTIPPTTKTTNNVQTTEYTHPEGSCTVYYSSVDPNVYNVGADPTTLFEIIASILCFLIIISIIWFYVLRSNKSLAGVMGGIDVATSLVGRRR